MSILQVDGITFGNATQLNSLYGIIPQNSYMTFYQASAPTGWTQYTGANDLALRVVDGTGGGGGGSYNVSTLLTDAGVSGISTFTVSGSVGDFTIGDPHIPAHDHNTGSQNDYGTAGASSPFRVENRQPRAYNDRKSYRATVRQRYPTTYRFEFEVRQPRTANARQRNPFTFRYRAEISYRQRRDARQRREFSTRYRTPFSYPNRQRRDFTFRQASPQRSRSPSANWFRSRQNRGTRQRRPWGRTRIRNRRPSVQWYRQRRQIRNQVWERSRNPFTSSNRWRNFAWSRSRLQVRYRQPRTYRQRRTVPARQRVPFTFSYRVPGFVRIGVTTRAATVYRQIARYPVVYNTRVTQRVLTPGGTIRAVDQGGPSTSATGGGQAHTHPFTGDEIDFATTLSPLRVQYVDVIICTID